MGIPNWGMWGGGGWVCVCVADLGKIPVLLLLKTSLMNLSFRLVKDVTFTRKTVKVLTLNKQFLNPELLYSPGNLDKFLVGLATQASQKFDNVLSDQVTNHLLQPKDKGFGLDLVALNIQRGRDHGLQGYNAFRGLCGLGKAKSFDTLTNLIPRTIVQKMREIYESVDDVDLFIGGISETPAPGSMVGPTFQVISAIFNIWAAILL